MSFVAPAFQLDAFNCPCCGAYAHMEWALLRTIEELSFCYQAKCSRCKNESLWRVIKFNSAPWGRDDQAGVQVYPDSGVALLPETDMPDDVKKDYIEASTIFSRSPRGAAALLRLGLQKLCKHLGEKGENINTDIRNFAVHPGEMSEQDIDLVASKMFDLLNFVVKKGITEPKELEALYTLTPEKPRKDAEAKDAKTKPKSA